MSSAPDLTSSIVRRERWLVAASLILLVGLCWWFLLNRAGMGGNRDQTAMASMPPPFAALVLMWWLMMAAMMLPSSAPMILLYGRVRHMRGGDAAIAQTWVFLLGYVLAWLFFSIIAAAIQTLIAGPAMMVEDRRFAAALLIAAGAYQLSPLKNSCLKQCRSPGQFLSRHWRPGAAGAVRLGLIHGTYCVGCCWLLMALLFVGGVMNLAWVVALAVLVAIEKLAPFGNVVGRAAGVALIASGIWELVPA